MTQPPESEPKARSSRQRYAAWLRSLPWPIAMLFLIAVMFSLLMVFEVVWPRRGGIEWVDNLVLAVALVLGMEAGQTVAVRRYGRSALYDKDRAHWRALGLFALTMLVVALVISEIADLFL